MRSLYTDRLSIPMSVWCARRLKLPLAPIKMGMIYSLYLVHNLDDTVLLSYGSTEQMKYGKATLTPQAPPCDKVQIMVLNFLATLLTRFTDKVAIAFRELVIESDHANGDTSLYAIEQCQMAGREYLDKLDEFSTRVARDGKTPRKDTYYEVMFLAMEGLVPAMKNVETVFGDKVKVTIENAPYPSYSAMIQDIIHSH